MHKPFRYILLFSLVSMLFSACYEGQGLSFFKVPDSPFPLVETDIQVKTITEGFKVPYGLAIVREDEYFISDRVGKLFHFKDGDLTEVEGLPEIKRFVDPRFIFIVHGGLMDISLHPDYANTG